ncbi:sensor histidine kinase [Bdellovibrio svalbardensis]|uniref:histidine kinase n=1 Tax=Bdellovibrio svalbardensis TaxID=2972972 RepID=A0ABT6DFI2_9BACT|nr:HAMP domain-containing sensor histidine kinase [Bdellovibrio svalbardensis]MDG0815602.1 HAMP domain-containing histidine kinase [Bdellovibrio svalbardensis]
MKVKLLAVLIAVAAIFIGAVLWRTDSFVYGDRMSWVEAQTRTQLGSMNYALAVELKSLQRVVSTFNAENFRKEKFNWTSVAPYYAAASFVVTNGEFDPQTLISKDNSKAATWTKEFVKSALGKVTERTTDLRYFVKPFQDNNRGRYVALVFLEGNKAYALIGNGEIFQSLIDGQRGSLSSFSVVTSTGLTVGHSVPEYLGTVMRDDPFFKEAQKSSSPHGGGVFKMPNGQELYGMFEQIPQSNLLVISSAPLSETMKGRAGLWWQFLLLGCGLVLVGIAGVLWVVAPAEKEIESLEMQLQAAKQKAAAVPVAEKAVAMDPALAQKEKTQTSMRVASALAHEMRGPLTSILGYSQMILAKAPEAEIVASTDSILRETRAAHEVLDKLLGYAGEEIKDKNSMKMEGPLARALKNLDGLFQTKGVKLTKNFQETAAMELHVEAMTKAIENILTNSVEAMERMPKKEIKLDLYEDEKAIHLIVEDCGEGIEPQNLQKIFDPFFTTRSFQNHMGLGLATAFGILKEHNAEVQVSSERGKGTKVSISFKKLETAPVLKAPSAKVEKVQEVMIAPELPQLKEQSPEREQAETHYAEVKATEAAKPPQSPLDVNIENLLELPAMAEAKVTSTENINDDKTPVIEYAGSAMVIENNPAAELAAMNSAMDSMDSMDDELTPVNLINAPTTAAKPKASKLDSYRVDIRRPGRGLN